MQRSPWIIASAGISIVGAVIADGSQAAAYPVKPVRCIVPFAPGGGADNVARILQAEVSQALGQSLVIDNRPGGSGIIGTEIVANSAPDGYTVLLITTTHAVNASFVRKLPYDSVRDFSFVSLLVSQPNILVINPAVGARSVKELVALAKAKPNGFSFASGGNGSSPHLSGELFKLAAGIPMTHVPYKSAGPAVIDVLGGHVDMIFAGPIELIPHIRSGRLRALAIADTNRASTLPELPTMSEAGYPGVETGTWYGVLAPARTPANVLDTLNAGFVKALQSTELRAHLARLGVNVTGSSGAQFQDFMKAEVAKWGRVIRDAGISP